MENKEPDKNEGSVFVTEANPSSATESSQNCKENYKKLQAATKAYTQVLEDLNNNDMYKTLSKDERSKALLEEIAIKNKEIIEQRDRAVRSEARVRELISELERLKKASSSEKLRVNDLRLSKARSEAVAKENKWQQLVQTSSKEARLLKEKVKTLQEENAAFKEKIVKLEGSLQEKDLLFNKLRDEKDAVETQLETTGKTKEKLLKECTELREKLEEYETVRFEQEKRVKESEEYKNVHGKVETVLKNMEKEQDRLKQKVEMYVEYKEKYEALSQEATKFVREVERVIYREMEKTGADKEEEKDKDQKEQEDDEAEKENEEDKDEKEQENDEAEKENEEELEKEEQESAEPEDEKDTPEDEEDEKKGDSEEEEDQEDEAKDNPDEEEERQVNELKTSVNNMRVDYKKLLVKMNAFLEQVGVKNTTLRYEGTFIENEKKLSNVSNSFLELQVRFADRERELKSLQKTNTLYEKRVEELQQKLAKLRKEYSKLMGEESLSVKLKDQIITDLKFRVLDLEKLVKEIRNSNCRLQNHIELYKEKEKDYAKDVTFCHQKMASFEGIIKENQKEIDRVVSESKGLKKQLEREISKASEYKNRILSLEQELLKKDNLIVRFELKLEKAKQQIAKLDKEGERKKSKHDIASTEQVKECLIRLSIKDTEIAALKEALRKAERQKSSVIYSFDRDILKQNQSTRHDNSRVKSLLRPKQKKLIIRGNETSTTIKKSVIGTEEGLSEIGLKSDKNCMSDERIEGEDNKKMEEHSTECKEESKDMAVSNELQVCEHDSNCSEKPESNQLSE